MKVYPIRKWAFAAICLLILALPVSRQWKMLIRGERTTGTVREYAPVLREHRNGDITAEYASEISCMMGDSLHVVHGPFNVEYRPGRSVPILYDPDDPSSYRIMTLTGFYLNSYFILPLILLVLWASFYLSYNSYTRSKGTGG